MDGAGSQSAVPATHCNYTFDLFNNSSVTPDHYPPCDLLLNGFNIGLSKQGQQGTAEIVGVAVWIPQLICYGIQEQVAS